MSTSPDIEIGIGCMTDLARRAARERFPHLFIVNGYATPEDCAAWFSGRPTLLDDVIEWFGETALTGRAVVLRDDRYAYLSIGLESGVDAVHFKLRWSDYVLSRRAA